jgi:hypothetical protein
MKKLFLLALLAIGMTANAETFAASGDAETNDGGIKLDEDSNWSMHLYVGVDIPTGAPSGVDFAPFRSWEVGWTIFQYGFTPEDWKTTFSAGVGIDWRNYTLSGHDKLFMKGEDEIIRVVDRDPKWTELSSRIHTLGISFPLLIKQSITKDFAISLGAQLNWNVLCRLNNSYEFEDQDVDQMTKKVGERPFTVDLMGIVHIGSFGVYCKYSPMSVLKPERGPEFKSVSLGIYF